ncbi:MAG TPA: hypothetical protein VFT45_22230 [Longimicrobium sp.]|nr:hypothetical protein [Longimicrobium sp.]
MKNAITAIDSPSGATGTQGILARLREALTDGPTREEARRRLRSKPGFFASLSPEALEMIRNCDGPERIGPPDSGR